MVFYWPTVLLLSIAFLTTLYHVSVPVRTSWRFNLPGAVFSLLAWVVGSYLLRWVLTVTAADSRSIYGPLAAPIAILLWLYLVAIAVLIGAAVNASFDTVFPQKGTTRARSRVPGPRCGLVCKRVAGEGRGRGRGRRPRSRQGRPPRPQPLPVVGARQASVRRAGDPGRHLPARLLRPRRVRRQQRPDGYDQPGRLDLLHDSHAQHDRLRRHRAGRGPRAADQRVHHHAGPHRLPGAADRDHPRGADLAGPRALPSRSLEEEDVPSRRRRRLRHEGPQRGRDAARQRGGSRVVRRRRPGRGARSGRALRRVGGRHRRRDSPRGAEARGRRRRRAGHHHHRPGRLERSHDADGPPAQPGACRSSRPRASTRTRR